jgi:hypothetical protein
MNDGKYQKEYADVKPKASQLQRQPRPLREHMSSILAARPSRNEKLGYEYLNTLQYSPCRYFRASDQPYSPYRQIFVDCHMLCVSTSATLSTTSLNSIPDSSLKTKSHYQIYVLPPMH